MCLLALLICVAFAHAPYGGVRSGPGLRGGGGFDAAGGNIGNARSLSTAAPASSSAQYAFFPQAGTLFQDLNTVNFVDLDAGPGLLTYDCGTRTYNGHNGHDSVIVGFSEQAIGVPVFAAEGGTVTVAQDGNADMNTSALGQIGNEIFIDHGGGHQTRYHHLKNGSVAVSVGHVVTAGTQIGMTASSGNSTWPHLHFGSYQDGTLFEPSSGPCRIGSTNWVNQIDVPAGTRLTSFTFGTQAFSGTRGLPFDQVVRQGSYVGGGLTAVWFRLSAMNWPASAGYQFVFRRPDGSIALTTSAGTTGGGPYAFAWWYFGYNVNLNVNGNWSLDFFLNGTFVARMPFTVTSGSIANRAPLPASVALDPQFPGAADVPFCRVTPSAVHRRDPDYDVVRYRYVWSLNGSTVRDVTSAALSDALPRGTVQPGDTVRCTITPNDGTVDGVPSTTSNLTQVNLLQNGTFAAGTTGWLQFATPDSSYIVSSVTGGVFQFYRQPPPPGTSNQALVFQETQTSLGVNARINARFKLGNSSSVRKRVSVLVHDGDFSDLTVCTFWMPAGQALTAYSILTHTTKPWNHATISFYAASAGSNGGFYLLDDVELEYQTGGPSDRTECDDPNAPAPPGGLPEADLLTNGNFDSGLLAPWGLFGQITSQIASGVFEFYRPPGTPSGVVLQQTGQAMTANQIVTATFALGNSSPIRKRVTVLLHDNDFSDLQACTFWLSPGQPLQSYAMVTYTTEAWTNATVSVYPATVGLDPWIRLDDVSFRRSPGATLAGAGCYEPGAVLPDPIPAAVVAAGGSLPSARSAWSGDGGAAPTAGATVGTIAAGTRAAMLVLDGPLDLREASGANVTLESRLPEAHAEVQVSVDGQRWETIALILPSDQWATVELDLSAFAGHIVFVRFVFDGGPEETRQPGAAWRVRNVRVEIHPQRGAATSSARHWRR